MLVGYNTNVSFRGNVYHVQTEDSGPKSSLIVTLLFLKGTIISSKRSSYRDLTGVPEPTERIRGVMKEQHKAMIRDLISGKFAADVVAEAPTESFPEASAPEGDVPLPEETTKRQLSNSLDDILLDFILKRKDS